jgi:hypothetical protein
MSRDYEINIEINAYDVETGAFLNRFNGIALSDDTIHRIMNDIEEHMNGGSNDSN